MRETIAGSSARPIAHGAARSAARLAILLAMLTVPLFAASPASAARTEFYGIAQGTLDLQDYEGMQAAKVHTERFLLRWRSVEPTKGSFDWTDEDNFIGQLASHGIRPLPFVWGSPTWVGSGAPRAAADQQRRRPGGVEELPQGGGGALRPRRQLLGPPYHQKYGASAAPLPVQSWQVWNEPNLKKFFTPGQNVAAVGPEVRQACCRSPTTRSRAGTRRPRSCSPGCPASGTPRPGSSSTTSTRCPGSRTTSTSPPCTPTRRDLDEFRSELNRSAPR